MALSKVNALRSKQFPAHAPGGPDGPSIGRLPGRSRTRVPLAMLWLAGSLFLSACDPDKIDTSGSSNNTGGNTGVDAGAGSGTGGDTGGTGAGDDGGTATASGSDSGGGDTADAGTTGGEDNTTGGASGGNPPPPLNDGSYSLELPATPPTLREGGEAIAVDIRIDRDDSHNLPVTLALDADAASAAGVDFSFADTVLAAGETETVLTVSLPIAARPRRSGSLSLPITAIDTSEQVAQAGTLEIDFEATERADIYLLAGQSNMAGSSGENAREALAGEPDAPSGRIFQLDVTINDQMRFPSPAAFTDIDRIAAPDRRIVTALDPLHDIFDRGENGKSGTTIGLGLSFAKAALADTDAQVVLVPTAWSDTGFCTRDSNRYEGMGWFGEAPDSPRFAGTLLHDRAIARTNLAIAETGGVLRGILWHQGEADSDVLACAEAYADNLAAMVASFRTNIAVDARGPAARGPQADIPFIVGTMSKGIDDRAPPLVPFGEAKLLVDGVHRNVANVVPLSGFVNADDLIPSNGFPCGQGSCIHFGAEALRELGRRYYEELSNLFQGG